MEGEGGGGRGWWVREQYIEITWTYYLVHCIYALYFSYSGQQKAYSDVSFFLYAADIACRHCTLLTVSTEFVQVSYIF